MKILMISRDRNGLDATSQTAERWRLLRDQGCELVVLLPVATPSRRTEQGIEVIGSGGGRFGRWFKTLRLAKAYAKHFDLITSQDASELGWIASRAARSAKKPWEIQDHGGIFNGQHGEGSFLWLRALLAKHLAKRATSIRSVNPASVTWLQARFPTKSYFLPIAASPVFADVIPQPQPFHLITVSRLVPVKQVDKLIQALAILVTKQPRYHLTIVGAGPLEAALKALVERLCLEAHVTFTGQANSLQEVANQLAQQACAVFASRHEGWGVAPVEAALAGTPVILTNTGCAPWLQKNQAAIITKSDTPQEIASTIESLLGTTGLVTSMRRLAFGKELMNAEQAAQAQVEIWKKASLPRLLVTIQAVDLDDSLHGFFHHWLEQAADHYAHILVLGLRVGRVDLPKNVEVQALRPASSHSKLRAFWTLLSVSWRRRRDYDAVFVRGDAIYVVLMGWLWRLLRKPIVFWYAHWTVTRLVLWANQFANTIVTSVRAACNHPKLHPVCIGQAIPDTKFTLPTPWPPVRPLSVLIFGRIQAIKHVKEAIEAFQKSTLSQQATLTIIGPRIEPEYFQALQEATKKDARIMWGPDGLPYEQVAGEFQSYDVMINAYPASLDKTIIEGMMSGQIVIAATAGIKDWLPSDLHWLHADDQAKRIDALNRIASMSTKEQVEIRERLRAAAVQAHSMQNHQTKLAKLFREQL